MTTWFTADTHFGHRRILELCNRPFSDVTEMREQLIRRWNERVSPGDTVWHLGDFAYRAEPHEIAATFSRLNGKKNLVIGNHDSDFTRILAWESIGHLAEIRIDSVAVVMCHYPIAEWRGFHRGAIHVFGHVHGSNSGVGRSCDVGVDVWDFRPVSLPEIVARIETRTDSRLQGIIAGMNERERGDLQWQLEFSARRRNDRERIRREAAEDRAKDAKERGE